MLAYTIIAVAMHSFRSCHLSTSGLRASTFRRTGGAVVKITWDRAPESLLLSDILMEASVNNQIERFRSLKNRGLLLWLSSAWVAFNCDVSRASLNATLGVAVGVHNPGKMEQFTEKLMHSSNEHFFVPARTLRQGTPSNPYVQQRFNPGYKIEVEPAKMAQRLMACREQLAVEWREDLVRLASGFEAERQPHTRRLVGLATRTALRSMLHDLELLPSQAASRTYLQNAIALHTDALCLNGDADELLTELERRPRCVSGNVYVDPPKMAAHLRLIRQEVARAMADTLSRTTDAHRASYAGFLEVCFEKGEEGR